MDDLITCPKCNRQLRLPAEMAEQWVRCPGCADTFQAPPRQDAPDHHVQDRPSPPMPGGHRDDPYNDLRRQDRDRLPEALPGGGVALALVVLLGVNILDSLVQMGVAAVRLQQVKGPANPMGGQGAQEEVLPTDCLPLLLLVPSATLFCMWMYRSYKNLLEMNVVGLRYSPGWAAGAFFVPILNLFRPYQIAQEMWRASMATAKEESAFAWRDRRGSGLISLWWALWIISGVIANISFRAAMHPGEAESALTTGMAADVVSILAALAAIGVVRRLRKRQERMLEELLQSPGDRDEKSL